MGPRFALGGHWEDFFRADDLEPIGIPFLDVQQWSTRARAAMSVPEGAPLVRNGAPISERALLPMPRDRFVVQAAR